MKRKVKLIQRFFKGAKIYFVTAIFASLMMTLLNSLTPQIFKFTIDSVLGSNEYPFLKENPKIFVDINDVINTLNWDYPTITDVELLNGKIITIKEHEVREPSE